jgi:hypothetical protein
MPLAGRCWSWSSQRSCAASGEWAASPGRHAPAALVQLHWQVSASTSHLPLGMHWRGNVPRQCIPKACRAWLMLLISAPACGRHPVAHACDVFVWPHAALAMNAGS